MPGEIFTSIELHRIHVLVLKTRMSWEMLYKFSKRPMLFSIFNTFAFFSSIGMAKAALEAIGGFNLFGKGHGATWSTITVVDTITNIT